MDHDRLTRILVTQAQVSCEQSSCMITNRFTKTTWNTAVTLRDFYALLEISQEREQQQSQVLLWGSPPFLVEVVAKKDLLILQRFLSSGTRTSMALPWWWHSRNILLLSTWPLLEQNPIVYQSRLSKVPVSFIIVSFGEIESPRDEGPPFQKPFLHEQHYG